jgi:hypothetical protein
METATGIGRTATEERFLEAIDSATHGVERYPSGTAFIDAERLDELGPVFARYIRDHRPVVLVFPDGDEHLICSQPRWLGHGLLLERAMGRTRGSASRIREILTSLAERLEKR